MDDDEPDEESDAFIAKYSGLIDDLIGSDVSTEEAFRYSEMADQGEVFSPSTSRELSAIYLPSGSGIRLR